MILSRRFGLFYDRYVRHGHEDPDALLRIASLIAGIPPEPKFSGVAELISAAAVDADKIDYVNRDAYACGISVGVDVSRIFLRSGFILVDRNRLIEAGLKENPAAEEIIFIVNASGMDTVDEITGARAALYQRVYLHAVTRTAEAVLARALEANARSEQKKPQLADAIGLWSISDDDLLRQLMQSRDAVVKRYGHQLHNRQMPKKACVFSTSVADMHMPIEAILPRVSPSDVGTLKKQIAHTPLEELTRNNITAGRGYEIERRIRSEVERIVEAIPRERHVEFVPTTSLELLVVIGTAYMDRVRKDCITVQNGELLRASQFTNVREQQDAFDIFKAVGFVMCDAEWRTIVLIAARSVLCEAIGEPKPTLLYQKREVIERGDATAGEDKISFLPRMILDLKGVIRRSGVKRSVVDALNRVLTDTGYFDSKPILAPPTAPGAENVQRVSKILDRYEGQRQWRVRSDTVAAFIDQFPPRLRAPMLQMLARTTFLDAPEVSNSLLSIIEAIGGTADVVPLSPNSGAMARMVTEREAKGRFKTVRFRREIREAIGEGSADPIIFVDDNVSSGTQARAQFLAWSHVSRETWPAECVGEDGIFEAALGGEELERLRARPIWVAVCAGRTVAEEKLKALLHELAFKDFRGIRYRHAIERAADWPDDLHKFLSEVGLSLMAWTGFHKSPADLDERELEFCKEKAFGYGNVGGLVATASNVPTATVTAVWCPGMHNGAPWVPLMIRQNKLRHLVVG